MEKNIYIENQEEIIEIYRTSGVNGVDNHLDIFDQRHGLKRDAKLRAEYCAAVCPENLSAADRALLEE